MASSLDFAVIAVYFISILLFGAWFSRYTKTTKDFFFGGQRFSWWLIAVSCVATVVGSYSFMKYSAIGFQYGFASSMTYLNDWLIAPFFLLGWFPIIYFSRVTSIPEYFERRFDRKTRIASLIIILAYMIGYVGINFYTLGVALQPLLNVNLYVIVITIAAISAVYMHAGGQTSVIMTDLVQGFVLLAAGFTLFTLGIAYLGGVDSFLGFLPVEHLFPLAKFNEPPKFNFVGIFWQDAVASSVAFYFMNQGVLMRFMSVKSPRDGRKALIAVVFVLMPVAAIAIANSGWLGRAMVTAGFIPNNVDPNKIFIAVANLVTQPGVFGLILAALTAALMSTIDTLITAICAIAVNDVWKPFIHPNAPDSHYLKVARMVSLLSAAIGVMLVPIFEQEKSIYAAHGKFVATITPAMVTVILLSVFWKRMTAAAAFYTLVVGSLVLFFVSSFWPELIIPLAHGISPEGGFKYIRALFGIVVSLILAIGISLFTKAKPDEEIKGLVIDSFADAKRMFKGSEPNDQEYGKPIRVDYKINSIEGIHVGPAVLDALKAGLGDLVYVADCRWYFGGLRSIHSKITRVDDLLENRIELSQDAFEEGHFNVNHQLVIEKII